LRKFTVPIFVFFPLILRKKQKDALKKGSEQGID